MQLQCNIFVRISLFVCLFVMPLWYWICVTLWICLSALSYVYLFNLISVYIVTVTSTTQSKVSHTLASVRKITMFKNVWCISGWTFFLVWLTFFLSYSVCMFVPYLLQLTLRSSAAKMWWLNLNYIKFSF